jgi:chemotaxis receptor (MCP) glutamine deamidase CheD
MQEEINILVVQVGEFGYRRIKFDSLTGEVWVKYIEAGNARLNASSVVI